MKILKIQYLIVTVKTPPLKLKKWISNSYKKIKIKLLKTETKNRIKIQTVAFLLIQTFKTKRLMNSKTCSIKILKFNRLRRLKMNSCKINNK